MNTQNKVAPRRKGLRDLTAVQLILLVNVGVYVLGLAFASFLDSDWIERFFSLSLGNIKSGYVWTFLTYAFLHGSFLHITLNMLVLYFTGPYLEARIGYRKTLLLFGLGALVGGLFWLLVELALGGHAHLVGASAGVVAIFTAFCMLEADRKMTFLLFFIIPITVRPRVLLAFLAGFEVFNFLFNELSPYASSGGVGYSAHLGGIAVGVVISLVWTGKIKVSNIVGPRKKYSGNASDHPFRINIISDAELKSQTDRILDKINSKGFSSLSDREKEILSIAKDRLK